MVDLLKIHKALTKSKVGSFIKAKATKNKEKTDIDLYNIALAQKKRERRQQRNIEFNKKAVGE